MPFNTEQDGFKSSRKFLERGVQWGFLRYAITCIGSNSDRRNSRLRDFTPKRLNYRLEFDERLRLHVRQIVAFQTIAGVATCEHRQDTDSQQDPS